VHGVGLRALSKIQASCAKHVYPAGLMHERGTYGAKTQNTPDLQVQNRRPPILGLDVTEKHAAVNIGAAILLIALGTGIGYKVTPKDPGKGAALGIAAGFALSLMGQQASALCRISMQSA
jgi:hypothetical protein